MQPRWTATANRRSPDPYFGGGCGGFIEGNAHAVAGRHGIVLLFVVLADAAGGEDGDVNALEEA